MAQQQNYLSQLTPEILQALASGQNRTYLGLVDTPIQEGDPASGFYRTSDGMYFAPRLETTYNGQDGETTQQTGYYGGYFDPTDYTLNHLRPYGIYDKSGKLTGTGAWSQTDESDLEFFAPALLAAAAGVGASMLGGLGGAAAGSGELVNGAFLGEGMASGIPAWDLAATNAGLSLATPAGAIMQNSPMSLIPESAMPGTVTGYTGPTFGGVGAGAAGAAGSLLSGIGDKALGIGATVLGGALGSQGTPDQTQEKKMDPRMDQFVYGELMPKVQGLLTSQMPLAQQAGDQMRMVGTGLLNQPIAPNGFERFTRGRY